MLREAWQCWHHLTCAGWLVSSSTFGALRCQVASCLTREHWVQALGTLTYYTLRATLWWCTPSRRLFTGVSVNYRRKRKISSLAQVWWPKIRLFSPVFFFLLHRWPESHGTLLNFLLNDLLPMQIPNIPNHTDWVTLGLNTILYWGSKKMRLYNDLREVTH